MPHTKAAKKHVRQSAKHREGNRARLSRVRTELKKVSELVEKGDIEGARKALPKAYQCIDKAAKAGVIKPNNASRKKSLLMRRIRRAETSSTK